MNASLYNGISGIKTSQFGIDVLANNIANIETTGFIGKTAEFSSIFSTMMNESNNTISNDFGYGSRPSAASLNTWKKGVFTPTDNPFDLALNGKGWFGVQRGSETLYTRAGEFSVDGSGYLVDVNGNYLLGTLGNNISPTTLSDETLEKFGKYYTSGSPQLLTAYNTNALSNIPVGEVTNQSKIFLPDLLYLPPEATTYINYQANLNPQIDTSVTQIDLDTNDLGTPSINTTNQTFSLSGTIANTTNLQNPQVDDVVILTVTDENGESMNVNTTLKEDTNGNLVWDFTDMDISNLDTSTNLTFNAKLQTTQEVPNTEHFTTEVISPDGEKNIVDLTFTKRVPQTSLETTWDATAQLLSYYEDYTVETYDPSKTYDPTIYNVDLGTNQVTKIYDPTLYKVDKGTNKVYQILDSQTGSATFEGSGALITSNMPTLSNEGVPLTLNIGNPDDGFGGIVSNVDLDKARYTKTDGYVEGFLTKYGMDGNDNVIAEFSNGRTSAIAKVGIYQFQNEQGLENVNSTLFRQSANSGNPLFFTDDNGINYNGTDIKSNYLEGSNVSYNTALTELIVLQKGFDSNAKSITTSDELIQNAINMKR